MLGITRKCEEIKQEILRNTRKYEKNTAGNAKNCEEIWGNIAGNVRKYEEI